MDIGTPIKDLGPVNTERLKQKLASVPEEAWTANTFRQEALAAGAHATARPGDHGAYVPSARAWEVMTRDSPRPISAGW